MVLEKYTNKLGKTITTYAHPSKPELMYDHVTGKEGTVFECAIAEYERDNKPINHRQLYSFRDCSEGHNCNNTLAYYHMGTRESVPFVSITHDAVDFGYIANGGFKTGFNTIYFADPKRNVDQTKKYTIDELVQMVNDNVIELGFGGLSYAHCGHQLSVEQYLDYDNVKTDWCEGGCGGCPDNWDYVCPYTIHDIFPQKEDLVLYRCRLLNWLKLSCSRSQLHDDQQIPSLPSSGYQCQESLDSFTLKA